MDTGTSGLTLFVAPMAPPRVEHPVVAPSATYAHVKRGIDVVLSVVALMLALPLLAVVAALVRCSSRGPVLFRQLRIGRDGRAFTVLKFRSMCSDAEARLRDLNLYESFVATGYKLPVADEFRLTRIGRFLRRSSLDELPQLFNVIRGDMSLVGPRPVVPDELASYGDLVHCYLGVRPGLTGMWQVTGRSAVQFPERAHIDHQYFLRRSVRLDLAILARTPRTVLRGDGAY